MAIKSNIIIEQGADFSVTVDIAAANGSAYNLTGHTLAAQMRKSYSSSNATSFSTSHNGAGGAATLTINNAVTTILVPGRYLYDVELTDSSNTITRVVEGIATVTPGMTRN